MGKRPLQPLAQRLRPEDITQIYGQEELLNRESWLTKAIESDQIPSMILWGPPGTGKTSLANVIKKHTKHAFVTLSAISGGIKEIRTIISEAKKLLSAFERRTILFVDEIHHFNKTQQEAFLPYVEDGTIILIAATTENPSFSIISPLLSRCRIVVFNPLSEKALLKILKRALEDEKGLGPYGIGMDEGVLELIAKAANHDARVALNLLESAAREAWHRQDKKITRDIVIDAAKGTTLRYDKSEEEHYNTISAFIKSLRGSDPDAAMYYMVRMLEAGEDPLFILRRMVIFAAEDVGNADPMALQVAVAATEAFKMVGLPEGRIPMAQAVTYLATAPKSNASYIALKKALKDVKDYKNVKIPLHLRNPVTSLMKELGYGKGYRYPHDEEGHFAKGVVYLPEELAGHRYYWPSDQGYEQRIRELMQKREQLVDREEK